MILPLSQFNNQETLRGLKTWVSHDQASIVPATALTTIVTGGY